MDVAQKMDNLTVFRILLSSSTQILEPLLSTHPSNFIIHNHPIVQRHKQYKDDIKSSTMKMKAADFFKIMIKYSAQVEATSDCVSSVWLPEPKVKHN